jgi:predicted metal-dependent hydrolase
MINILNVDYIIILLLLLIIVYKFINKSKVIYIEYINNNIKKKYLVRNYPDRIKAAKTLFEINMFLLSLVNYLYNDLINIQNDNMDIYIKNLKNKIDTVKIQESSEDSSNTSYSVNKGDILVFCIRSKYNNKIHDINDLKYVAIHELAHIACPEIGHTELFYKINKYLLKKAISYQLYNYIDYDINNIEYCGIQLNKNIINE